MQLRATTGLADSYDLFFLASSALSGVQSAQVVSCVYKQTTVSHRMFVPNCQMTSSLELIAAMEWRTWSECVGTAYAPANCHSANSQTHSTDLLIGSRALIAVNWIEPNRANV